MPHARRCTVYSERMHRKLHAGDSWRMQAERGHMRAAATLRMTQTHSRRTLPSNVQSGPFSLTQPVPLFGPHARCSALSTPVLR